MCGLFGAIGTNYNIDRVRALALINESRGNDALGFFDSTGKSIKYADNPYKCLGRKDFTGFLRNARKRSWFLAGHTRSASFNTGSRLTSHAHPFRYGKTIGAHNGYTPRDWKDRDKYPVDSMIIFERLEEHKSDYQKALEDLEGYWGLSWLDGYTDRFYLSTRDNEIALVRDHDTYYYSSDVKHLAAAIGHIDTYWELKDGLTCAFFLQDGELQIQWCTKFEPKTKDWKTTKAERSRGSTGGYVGGWQQGSARSGGYTATPGTAGSTGGSGATAPCGFRVPSVYKQETGQEGQTYQKELWEREACCVCQDRVSESEQVIDEESGDTYCRDCARDFNIDAWNRYYYDSEDSTDPNDPFHFDEEYVASKDSTCIDEAEWEQAWADHEF